jgi:hypothetical protein
VGRLINGETIVEGREKEDRKQHEIIIRSGKIWIWRFEMRWGLNMWGLDPHVGLERHCFRRWIGRN